MFTGKVFCDHCGEEYRPYLIKYKLSTGESVTRYDMMCKRRRLPSRYDSKCFNRKIRREEFEKEIFDRLHRLGTSGEIELSPKSINYGKQIERIDKKINKLLDLYMDDRLSKTSLDAKLADLNAQKEKLLAQAEEAKYEESEIEQFIKSGIPNLFECDLDTQTAIVDLFINKIMVKEDGLQIIWNQ